MTLLYKAVLKLLKTAEDTKFSKPVLIGDNVWIGMNACILPGFSIGGNSILKRNYLPDYNF